MRRLIVCAALILSFVGGAARAEEKKGAASAVDAAKAYVGMFKERQALKAVENNWDMDAMMAGMFGEDLKKQSKEELAEMNDRFMKFLGRVFANEQVATLMATATYSDFEKKELEDKNTAVDFTVTLGETRIPNRLVFVKKGEAWKIIDAGNNGKMMVPALKKAYGQAKGNDASITPLSFVRAMTDALPKK
jgi:ABC-type transporter MlaC component